MDIKTLCTLISSFSFFGYVISYFTSPNMKNEFIRFGLEKFSLLTILLQIVGASGLLIGLKYKILLTISSAGLTLLMFLGLLVRIKIKDNFWISFPAFFFMVLNAFILWESL
tara:strand:+ start:358 stop:693 length:336 start_codon:yes stop_codon:yes gene_type:complete